MYVGLMLALGELDREYIFTRGILGKTKFQGLWSLDAVLDEEKNVGEQRATMRWSNIMDLCVHRPVVGFALDRGKAIVQHPDSPSRGRC